MNILEFINSIEYSDVSKCVSEFFDENVALYNMVRNYIMLTQNEYNAQVGEEISIDGSSIRFTFKFNNDNDAVSMYNHTNDSMIRVFNSIFHVNQTLSGSQIIVELIKK